MSLDFHLRNTPEYKSGMYKIVTCPVCGMATMDSNWICRHCGWEYDGIEGESKISDTNGMTLKEYRALYQAGGVGMLRSSKDRWIQNLHPQNIPVTKTVLYNQVHHRFGYPKAVICALTIGKAHPSFEEWLTKACYQMQMISSFVYIVKCPENEKPFTHKVVKPAMKKYEEWVFDSYCENAEECRIILERLAQEEKVISESDITTEIVDRVFEKFCAFKRYTLPMLANILEFEYFSFYRHILLYVAEHDTYPDAPIASWYKYPLLPGMAECDIDFGY